MDRSQAAALLGVSEDASDDEAKKAYQTRARLLHPDRFAGASESDVAAANSAMAQLNLAYETFSKDQKTRSTGRQITCSDCGKKNRITNLAKKAKCANCGEIIFVPESTKQSSSNQEEAVPVWADAKTACDICGWGPSLQKKFYSVTGLILFWRWGTFDARVCRYCGFSAYNEAQAHTLTKGWWGFVAPLATAAALVGNLVSVNEIKDLAPPRGKNFEKYVLLPIPAVFSRPWYKRLGPWLGSGAFVALLIWIFAVASSEPIEVASPTTDPLTQNESTASTETLGEAELGFDFAWNFPVGSCIKAIEVDGVPDPDFYERIDCEDSYDFGIFGSGELSSTISTDVESEELTIIACNKDWASYFGSEPLGEYTYWFPGADDLLRGDRTYTCAIKDPRG